MTDSIGVAVIGGGMAGRAHAAGYRSATTLFGVDRPDVRLVAIADAAPAVADDVTRRYGFERAAYDWRAIADSPDIDAVSVVVANHLHREIVEGLLEAGKHVLCEKPLAATAADGEAMVAAADRSDRVTAVGFTYRRSPAVEAIRRVLASGTLGDLVHFNGHYWCEYALDATAPITWRYRGDPGTGALADVGSHLIEIGSPPVHQPEHLQGVDHGDDEEQDEDASDGDDAGHGRRRESARG
nr:Gfo/Idh/MocA family oxidoreductase [Mycolicibacterium sp. 018/SC-01/001]